MKNVKRTVLSLALTLIMIICAISTPILGVSAADRDIYSYLVTNKLGDEWDAWNSMNEAVDAEGNKIPTEEYIEIVNDPTNSGHGGVLRVGNADYATTISLRVTQTTAVNYSHKYEGLFYLDGEIGSDSYILFQNADTWATGSFYRSRLELSGMTAEKWVTVNTENAAAGVDNISGMGYCHIDSGYVTLIFSLQLEAGNYLYIDDLAIAAGNGKTYQKNIDTENGDKIIYINRFNTFDDYEFTRTTKIDEWTVGSSVWAGTITEDGNTEIILYNNEAVYSGSITQNVIGLENGTYTLSVECRSNGHSSAVIAADGFGASKIQKTIGDESLAMHTVTLSGLEVTQNYMYVSIWVGGQTGEWVVVDNVTLTKEGSDENYVLNGDFESAYSATENPAEKASRAVGWSNWIGSALSADSIFIADEGYNSSSSMAVTYPVEGGSNFNQTVLNLTAGNTYVVSAYVKASGTGTVRLYFKNYGSSSYMDLPKSDTWVKVYKEITLPEAGNRLTLEFYSGGKAGDWFMVDNIKVVEKTNPSVNLITNGDFETIVGDLDGDTVINGSDLIKLREGIMDSVELITDLSDVNADSAVDARDIVRMKKYIAGADVILGKN